MRERTILCLALASGLFLSQPAWAYPVLSDSDAEAITALKDEGKKVTLDLKSVTVKQLFDAIHKQTGMDFLYNTEQLASLPPISVKAQNESVASVMTRVFSNTDFDFKIEGNMVTIVKRGVVKAGTQLRKVKGFVLDKEKYPIIGATVMIKGTHYGTVTDANGYYEMDVKPGEVLAFSFIGLDPKEVVYNGAQELSVELLESSNTTLNDVVVTGIFKKAKESYTGSASTVTKEQLKMYKGQNLLQTLKNIDASVNFSIDNVNGSNPNNLPSINIRGNASLPTDLQEFNETQKNTVNTPLIIMDGFEISLTKLMDYNDDEIESINILKDAAATAIYGSRGANGVIVVITKEPESGKLRVNAELGLTLEVPDLTSYDLLHASDKLALEKAVGLFTSQNPTTQTNLDTEYNRRLRLVLSGIDTDWLSKPLHTGVGQRYNLRLEGGSDEFRWSASAAYSNTQGAMKGSERRNFNGAITLMYRVKSLIFRNYTSFGLNRSQESNYGTFSDYVKLQPYESPYDENRNLVKSWSHYTSNGKAVGNPLYDATLGSYNKNDYQDITNNFSIEWRPTESFTLRGQLGLSSKNTTGNRFVSPYNSLYLNSDYATEEGFFRKGSYQYGTGKTSGYDANLTASYSKVLKDVHQLYFGLDLSASENKDRMYTFLMEGYNTDHVTNFAMAQQYAKNSRPSGSSSFYRRVGVTANANYMYDNRYYVDFSYRVDGNSNFGSDKKYAPFWSLGLGWSLHNENFLKGNEVISNLRLKASYGQTGTQLTSSVGAVTTYKYATGDKYLNWNISSLQGLGNKDLTWQTTDEMNLGLEWGLWQNRVKGSFDFYTKKTSDLLSYMDMPLSTGFSSYFANVGAVKNVGFETSLSGYIIRNSEKELNWIISGQLMYNKNEITELSADIQAQNEKYLNSSSDVEIANLLQVGRPQNSIYGVRSLGIDPSTGEEVFLDKDGKKTNTWSAKDMVYLGQREPKYRGIISSMLNWKKFTLNVSCGYHWGGQLYNETLKNRVEVTSDVIYNQNVDARVWKDRWINVGDVVAFNKISNLGTRSSSRFVMDDNVFTLQSVSLQYRWDTDWLKKTMPVQSIIFGVNMSDLFYLSSVKVERGTTYPFSRNIQGSVKLMF